MLDGRGFSCCGREVRLKISERKLVMAKVGEKRAVRMMASVFVLAEQRLKGLGAAAG